MPGVIEAGDKFHKNIGMNLLNHSGLDVKASPVAPGQL